MHEISVLAKAVDLADKAAAENQIEKIRYLTLEVGELTGYLPVFFEKYFPIVTGNYPRFCGAQLRIQVVKGEALCENCHSLYNVMQNEGCCPQCGSRNKKILGGLDLKVREIGY